MTIEIEGKGNSLSINIAGFDSQENAKTFAIDLAKYIEKSIKEMYSIKDSNLSEKLDELKSEKTEVISSEENKPELNIEREANRFFANHKKTGRKILAALLKEIFNETESIGMDKEELARDIIRDFHGTAEQKAEMREILKLVLEK